MTNFEVAKIPDWGNTWSNMGENCFGCIGNRKRVRIFKEKSRARCRVCYSLLAILYNLEKVKPAARLNSRSAQTSFAETNEKIRIKFLRASVDVSC